MEMVSEKVNDYNELKNEKGIEKRHESSSSN